MSQPVSIVLVGISGMGSVYLEALLGEMNAGNVRLEATVDPFPERCSRLEELRSLGIPLFPSLEDFAAHCRAALAVIASPIHCHRDHTILALSQGSDVLCEKPAAATVQDVRAMIDAARRTGRWVAVGYQWSFSTAVQSLKRDIMDGRFGRPRRLKCLYLWPRDEAYYRRNDWAGKKKDKSGHWILDSPANNAMAHDLHNMFYILGRTRETSALPVRVEAELYRAYGIENYDTVAMRAAVEDGTEVLFYASHAAGTDTGPVLSYEFEKGTVSLKGRGSNLVAVIDEVRVNYGSPDDEPLKKLSEAVAGVRSRRPPACGLEAALSQTLCINGAQESMPEIRPFPAELLEIRGEPGWRTVAVRGLADVLSDCFERNSLPSELGIPWARPGRTIRLRGYKHFPGGSPSRQKAG